VLAIGALSGAWLGLFTKGTGLSPTDRDLLAARTLRDN
jgi:hypothetical protein